MFTPSTASRSRAWLEVDLAALRANLARLQAAAGPGVGVLPMVKADAYGLGMAHVATALARALAPAGPWGFGVAAVAEGERLRADGWAGRVLVFSPIAPGEYARAAAAGLTLGLSSHAALERWRAAAAEAARRLAFHVEIDTGMGRAGLPWAEAAEWGPALAAVAADALDWEGCYTHFHSADEPDLSPTQLQTERFRAAVERLPAPAGAPRLLHASNSAAALRCGSFGLDLVRPGIALYGGLAGPGTQGDAVVAVRARLALVRTVQAGATLGYGATYAARRAERWGTVTIGYGDGIPRALAAAGGEALVRGVRVPIIGRISMDVLTLALSALPAVEEGDVVTLIGRDGAAAISVDEVARRCGTISYEILTGLTPRLPRVYSGD